MRAEGERGAGGKARTREIQNGGEGGAKKRRKREGKGMRREREEADAGRRRSAKAPSKHDDRKKPCGWTIVRRRAFV